ncbi:S8 family serine peptidase [uncultured Piscinibacter sp.]|uniref:S8 family serine peptidase n=1 Tax=uncultured Piscinibacter sp. TaxID=1131835 RepID=UPI00260D2CFA|nr:S8 family serine peptidase [uncultured Piscinibacter sp.]
MQDWMRWQQGLMSMAAVGLMTASVGAVAGNPNGRGVNSAYIVQMADAPAVAYTGGIAGYAATKPAKGQKIDPNGSAVVQYKAFLAGKQDAALSSVGGGRKLYNYGYAFNGFAAELTEAQAQKLAQMPGVLAVTKDEIRKMDTTSTPSFLGLTGAAGFWATKAKGENVVIGIIDSGVWPEHPSFSDRTDSNGNFSKDGKLGYQQLPGWNGKCTPGEAFAASHCNQKLIGAQYFNAGFGGNAGIKAQFPYEFNSPRDADGHGSHTASTAGGNANVVTTGPAAVLGNISGIAPRARIAVYKTCWGNNGEGGCAGVDNVAAIDQAVADGVDVINYSISGTSTNFLDPTEVAFLFAADAGVFVAASAGNSGPSASTVAHPSPWITTVAAGTHNRDGQGSVTLGNGATYTGASVAKALGSAPLIDSTAAGLPGADPTEVALCYGAADGGAVLDPAKVAGKIVVCDRGVTARTNKSLAVQQAGGAGMILVNTSPSSLNADFHSVPTVHVQSDARAAIKAYAALAGATAAINDAAILTNAPAPFTASFSSRGPLRAGAGDLLKPDLIAPGVDILAAVSPIGYNGRTFDLLSGTSMSSPHVAGLAALMKELKPTWSPMAIKSALMTTGRDVLDPNVSTATRIFRQGAGHVQPMAAADPGLVFDSGFSEWLGFLCGTGQLTASYCPSIRIDPSNLNVASIAIGDLAGEQTVTRRVTNVGGNPASYTPSISGLSGFNVTMSPATLTIPAGETRSFTVKFVRTTADLNGYTGGQFSLSDGTRTVRMPVVVRPVALAAPRQVSGTYNVTFGYDGPFGVTARGLIPAALTDGNVTQDPDQTFDPGDPSGTVMVTVNVPAGTTYARFSLFDGDVAPGSDVDLYVYGPTGAPAGSSGNGGSDEEVNLVNPAPGTYYVFMHGWGLPAGASPFKLHSWALGTTAAGNMTVTAPTQAVLGQTGVVSITTNGLTAGVKYLGAVAYTGPAGLPNPTIVRIDTP